jgi:hypothetical protein
MACFTCTPNRFRDVSKAMAKAAGARLRQIGVLPASISWTTRATICERCPLKVVRRGVSYCGTPFLQKIDRDPVADGCGCPTREKAKSPAEHCPVDYRHRQAVQGTIGCTCKWCSP